MRCTIWYHLHNLKNMKSNHGGVLFLVKLQADFTFSNVSGEINFRKFFKTCYTVIKCNNKFAVNFYKNKSRVNTFDFNWVYSEEIF